MSHTDVQVDRQSSSTAAAREKKSAERDVDVRRALGTLGARRSPDPRRRGERERERENRRGREKEREAVEGR